MLRTIAKIDWGKVPCGVFITLTYPDDYYNRDYYARTIDRSQFLRSVEKYCDKNVPVLWRCEWKPRLRGKCRGLYMPHFHIMALGVAFLPHKDVRSWWRQSLACHGPLATDVRGIKGAEGCGRYLAKYLSKSSSLDNGAYLNKPWMNGRHWGLTRHDDIPWAETTRDDPLTEAEFEAAKRAFVEENAWASSGFGGSFTVLGQERVEKFLKRWADQG